MVRAFVIDYGKLGSTPVIVLIKKGHWFKSSMCFTHVLGKASVWATPQWTLITGSLFINE